jgi:heavy-metal-associated domain-containing protein
MTAPARLRIVSHFPGRLRVRAEPFRQAGVGEEVAARLRAEAGVEAATVATLTGSLLVAYRPRELQLPRLVELIVRAAGLEGLEPEQGAPSSAQGAAVRDALGRWNDAMLEASRGRLDARTGVPATLAGLGVLRFVLGPRRLPEWYDLLIWSFTTFTSLNPPRDDDHGKLRSR